MDPVTHGLLGLLLATLFGVPEKYGQVAALTLVLASMAPDLDALPIGLGQKYFYKHHRTLFHSLAGALLLALGLAAAVLWLTPLKAFWLALTLSVAGVLFHLAVDFLSSWGIPLLYPFSPRRYSLDLVWFIDLFILVVSLGTVLWIGSDPGQAALIAGGALASIGIYAGFRAYQHRQVAEFMRHEAFGPDSSGLAAVIPPRVGLATWHAVERQGERYVVHDVHFCLAPRSITTPGSGIAGTHVMSSQTVGPSPGKAMIDPTKQAELVQVFLGRARFPVAFVQERDSGYRVEWQDVHLMLVGGGIRGVIVQTDRQGHITGQRFQLKPELEMLRQD